MQLELREKQHELQNMKRNAKRKRRTNMYTYKNLDPKEQQIQLAGKSFTIMCADWIYDKTAFEGNKDEQDVETTLGSVIVDYYDYLPNHAKETYQSPDTINIRKNLLS